MSNYNISIGRAASSAFGNSTAIGREADAWGEAGIAIGYYAAVRTGASPGGTGSIAIGKSAAAQADNCIALGSGSLNPTANSMTIGSPTQGMDFNVTGNVTILNNGDTSYGHLNVCQGTASILHLSGCSPITVHAPLQMQSGLALSFNGATNTAKITNNGTNLDINSPGSIVLNSGNNTITSSAAISASSFWANGVELTPGGGGTPAGANTQIQFNDAGAFGASSTFKFDSSANFLSLEGSASVSSSLTGGQEIFFGSGTNRSIGTRLVDDGGGEIFDYLSIGHGSGSILLSASFGVEVMTSPSGAGLELFGAPLTIYEDVDSDTGSVFLSNDGVGIGVEPKVSLDVHYTGTLNPQNLSANTGGGEVVYFGTGSLTNVGGVHYLNTDGGWAPVNAKATGSGHNQLLGIALGADPSTDGVLTKGFFNATGAVGYYIGSFIKGAPVYVQAQTAPAQGKMSGSAPTGSGQYVRVLGYATDTAHVIYFNPDATYVELA